ncbi:MULTISPECIES: Wzz/FepE/Etk N-terminal domain-containing protein [Thalassotalea]|uniref:Wzz/FepE/Etk N-terminal domain-containing protein n=1 Tax=Thalassotalea TaxID=1518149 RepID=UPI000945945E|nr:MULTISPECIES: Wzz/FepE/Etk N-terminal domain-containing protein [Thalassotalea]OKY24649.1 hypothetical protein BI291_05500 [Thalassotalea sp. PP2-459]
MKTKNELEEISLTSIVYVLFKHKFLILGFVSIFAVFSVVYALSLPNKYTSHVKLMSNNNAQKDLSSLAGNLGGLAGLAGVSLGGGNDEKVSLAKELLKSRAFLNEFVTKHNILVPLIAADGLDDDKNLVINNKLYDEKANKWVREVFYPKPLIPSAEDVYLAFENILTVESDNKSGVVNISLEFLKPDIAQQWLEWLVEDVNEEIREQDLMEAKSSIKYLENVAQKTNSKVMKETFYQLIEEQMKTLLLTEVRKEYVFKTVDPASYPEDKSSPKRALICIGGTLASGVFIVMLVLVRHFSFSK